MWLDKRVVTVILRDTSATTEPAMRHATGTVSILALCTGISGAANGGTGCTAQQLAKLIASDAAGGDNLGFSVAVSGGTAVVGAYQDDHAGGTFDGSAYIFVR